MSRECCDNCKYGIGHTAVGLYEEPCCSCRNHSNFEEYKPQPDATQVLRDVKQYLIGVAEEWENLPDHRKYELANIQVFNHTRKEMDDLEAYAERHGFNL